MKREFCAVSLGRGCLKGVTNCPERASETRSFSPQFPTLRGNVGKCSEVPRRAIGSELPLSVDRRKQEQSCH